MIILTGGAGFVGFNLLKKLISLGYKDIVVIDNNIHRHALEYNFVSFLCVEDSYYWLPDNAQNVDMIFHIGARTDTMEMDVEIFNKLNLNYSKFIWNLCCDYNIPLIYASSAATYGKGEFGFDDTLPIDVLKPLNPYGQSKQDFDLYAKESEKKPPIWIGLKFFNVYGPYENHKGKMASVIWHFYNQIKNNNFVELFQSHIETVNNGEQMRDFIYVEDVVEVITWFYNLLDFCPSGIYNLGTGKARTYNDLAKAIFNSLEKDVDIRYKPTPIEIRNSYQYYTEAKMNKLRSIDYDWEFTSLEDGINKYIKFLENENC